MSPRHRNTSPLFQNDVGLRVNACRQRLRRMRSRRISSTPVERDATASKPGRSNDLAEPEDPGPPPRDVFEAMWVTGRGLGFADLIRGHGDIMDPGLARLLPLAERYSLADYYRALEQRRAFNARMAGMFEGVPKESLSAA